MKSYLSGAVCAFLAALASPGVQAAAVVSCDEWTLPNAGYVNASLDAGLFVTNFATLFSGGASGAFQAYTNDVGSLPSRLGTTSSGTGHTYATGTGFALTQKICRDSIMAGKSENRPDFQAAW
jgi:hypothetical protein